jgi:hypothetical protein
MKKVPRTCVSLRNEKGKGTVSGRSVMSILPTAFSNSPVHYRIQTASTKGKIKRVHAKLVCVEPVAGETGGGEEHDLPVEDELADAFDLGPKIVGFNDGDGRSIRPANLGRIGEEEGRNNAHTNDDEETDICPRRFNFSAGLEILG